MAGEVLAWADATYLVAMEARNKIAAAQALLTTNTDFPGLQIQLVTAYDLLNAIDVVPAEVP